MNHKATRLLLCVGLIVLVGWFGWQQIKAQSVHWLPIKYVRIEGAFQYIAKIKVQETLQGQVNKGLYNTNILQIQQLILALPWVDKVHVKRIWPDTIGVQIIEQVPVVRWGQWGLLNELGEKFIPDNIDKFSQLPMLMGPEGKEHELLEVMQGLALVMNDRGRMLAEFQVSDRRAWTITLDNSMVLKLGRNEPLKKFQRFLRTFTLIGAEKMAQVAVADLRYPNGYALAWKQNKIAINWNKLQ